MGKEVQWVDLEVGLAISDDGLKLMGAVRIDRVRKYVGGKTFRTDGLEMRGERKERIRDDSQRFAWRSTLVQNRWNKLHCFSLHSMEIPINHPSTDIEAEGRLRGDIKIKSYL